MRFLPLSLPAIAATTITGCAGSTVGSGVGDKLLAQPPYYAGAAQPELSCVAHLPIVYQRGDRFDPSSDAGTPLARLLGDMNARLDSMARSVPLRGPALPGTPPDVSFGCELDATGDCLPIEDQSDPHAKRLRLAVARPSGPWVAAARERAAAAGAAALLVVTVEIGQHWVHQRNLLGAKELRLGTGYVQRIPWLTSLDAPVQVVQLTGAVVNPDGRAIRIGAEGLLARRTGIVMSGFGAQALIREEDIAELRELRREDLPGRPLVWEAALETLTRDLTGGSDAARCRAG